MVPEEGTTEQPPLDTTTKVHYTHFEKVGAIIDVQTESGSSQTTADLARRGLRTTTWKNWSANGLPTVHKILSLCAEPKIV